jgi:integrase
VEFVLPLSDPAAKLLRGRPPVEWFFSLDGERPLSHLSDLKKEIDKRSGVTGWRLHDVRRTAATLMGDAGVSGESIERVLATSSRVLPGFIRGRTTSRRSYD